MPFINCPNIASFEVIFDALGQRVENVYHVSKISEWSVESLTEVAGIFVDWWGTNMQPITSNAVTFSKVVAKDLTTSTAPAIEYVGGLPLTGGYSSTPCLPLNVTCAVSFGTALRGRSYRGRIYHIGLGTAYVSGNQLGSGTQGSLLAGYAALVDAVSVGTYALVVLSKYSSKAPRSEGIGTPIISVSIDINLDSQRRRLTGRGQ